MKKLKEYLPPILVRKLTGLFYGWSGDYKLWDDAKKDSLGYNDKLILETVKNALLKVKNGDAIAERDSVLFEKVEYSFPLLSSLLWISSRNDGRLSIIDFGGSLGSSYFQNIKFLEHLNVLSWNIVEQKHFVDSGKKNFEDKSLHFYETIEDCIDKEAPNVILLSSVIQYIENPYELLDYIIGKKIKYILIDRTPFIEKKSRITVQKVNPKIYKASYPCWFFNETEFVNSFVNDYEIVMDFDSLDRANIKSNFKGYLFKLKK